MTALTAVMIMVAIRVFGWHSVCPSALKRMPKSETFVMVTTVVLVLPPTISRWVAWSSLRHSSCGASITS